MDVSRKGTPLNRPFDLLTLEVCMKTLAYAAFIAATIVVGLWFIYVQAVG